MASLDRRELLMSGLGAALMVRGRSVAASGEPEELRRAFPRLEEETYLNAAAMMPLSTFSESGLRRYLDFQRLGGRGGRLEYVREMRSKTRGLFAALIGAKEAEIGLVHCTKAGEQIVLDSIAGLDPGRNIVTNDLHFSGSLHNLVGLQRAGRDVRIVRARDWKIHLEDMVAAIDGKTALVAVSLVSNINGHIENLAALSEAAHAHGALVYADVIQAAGIVPFDVHALGIDVAACSCYKWLYGVHGTGFLFVNEALQGTRIADRLYPGRARHNYAPWVEEADSARAELIYEAPTDATRYQPGHVSYLGYCAAYEGLEFLQAIGVEAALSHSVRLNQRLRSQLDPERFKVVSPHLERSPIITLEIPVGLEVSNRLEKAKVAVSLSGRRLRVSPALYNNEADVDRLVGALTG